MTFETLRVLIWGKTYPELSSHHMETVCTGGCLEDGTPVRLYPVPLRYLGTDQQYRLYDWVDVPVARNPKDQRPESFKVDSDELRLVGHINSNARDGWRARRDVVFCKTDWQFGSIEALKAAERESGRSMGIVTPGRIDDVRLVEKSARDRAEFDAKHDEVTGQRDLFRSEYRALDFLTHQVKLFWRCAETCAECTHRPHKMAVLDWGLLELGRRDGWEAARSRLESYADLRVHDFRLFMGSFRQHPRTFGIIGLWYPKHPAEPTLL